MRKIDYLLGLLALGTVVVSVGALAAAESWLLDIASHFRAQYLTVQAALLMLLLLRARWVWCLALMPFMALNSIPLAPYWPRPAGDDPFHREPLTLMSANLNAENTDYAAFMELLEEQPPDIVLLIELDAAWSEAIRPLHAIYPYRIEIPRADRYGIGLFSKRSFADQHSLQLQTTTAIDVQVPLSGRLVRVLGVHLRSPTSAEFSAERDRQLSQLSELARREAGPLLVLGDFNISPYSPIFATTLGASGLEDTGRERGWSFSWPTFLPILGVPIDLFLTSEHFVTLDHRRGPDFGSDHYPMTAAVALR